MATVTFLPAGQTLATVTPATLHGNVGKVMVIERDVDFAAVLAAKGSALAASDVIEVLAIPAATYIHYVGVQTLVADNATTLTLDVGTGDDPNNWIAAYDQGAAAAGAYATPIIPGTTATENFVTTADTIDVTFATLTGTLSSGKIRVFALVSNFADRPAPGLAPRGG